MFMSRKCLEETVNSHCPSSSEEVTGDEDFNFCLTILILEFIEG